MFAVLAPGRGQVLQNFKRNRIALVLRVIVAGLFFHY
jgi:hypothetical protein